MSDFKKARAIMQSFHAINQLGWVEVVNLHESGVPSEGTTIGVLSNIYNTFLWTLNPVRVVSSERNMLWNSESQERYSQILYSTLEGHLLEGEERFRVSISKASSDVSFEIISYAKGHGLLGSLCLPLIQPLQNRFLQESIQAMQALMKHTHYKVESD